MAYKIDFFIRCRKGGGFIARAYTPALEAEGDTLIELRQAIKRLVRAKTGGKAIASLRVGAPASLPTVHRASGESVEALRTTPTAG
jgi:hypothetical protein